MNYKKNSKPDYLNMSTREILEDQFKRGGFFEDEEAQEQMYEWQGDGCDDCAEYEGQQFTLDNAPNTHPNCKCQLVADVDGRAVSISAGDLQRQRFDARKNYVLGSLSAIYESNSNPAAIGYDAVGGYSYGKYQIETKKGTMGDYINYLNKNSKYKNFATELQKAGGLYGAQNKTADFANKWQELSKNSDFVDSQTDFIVDKKLAPVLENIKDIQGLNLESRHPVVKDVIYSTAVQHGETGASNVLHNALGNNVQQMSDKEIITKIYNERAKIDIYFRSSAPNIKDSVERRLYDEGNTAINLLYR